MENNTPNHTTIIINNQPSAEANAVSSNQGASWFDWLIIAICSVGPFGWGVIAISALCFLSVVGPLLFIIPAIYLGVNWYKKKTATSEETPQENSTPTSPADKVLPLVLVGLLSLFPNYGHAESPLTETDKKFIAGMCEEKEYCISAYSGYLEARLSSIQPTTTNVTRPDFTMVIAAEAPSGSRPIGIPFWGTREACEAAGNPNLNHTRLQTAFYGCIANH